MPGAGRGRAVGAQRGGAARCCRLQRAEKPQPALTRSERASFRHRACFEADTGWDERQFAKGEKLTSSDISVTFTSSASCCSEGGLKSTIVRQRLFENRADRHADRCDQDRQQPTG